MSKTVLLNSDYRNKINKTINANIFPFNKHSEWSATGTNFARKETTTIATTITTDFEEIYVPSDYVVSRTGYECVVRKSEQWYIKYGESVWKNRVKTYIEKVLKTNSKIVKDKLLIAVEWLKSWCFSREYGLGTSIPWDTKFNIDSLSDSTIYMAYYTVCYILHKDIYGKFPDFITPDQLSDNFWDDVFGTSVEYKSSIPKAILDKLRSEFRKWYPLSLRVSGKDLINNHLIMSIYNHIAIFGEDLSPKYFACNGFVTINKKPMSKSKGTFITLKEAMKDYGTDALRIALAQSGDGCHDADFNTRNMKGIIKKINKFKSIVSTPYDFIDFQIETAVDEIIVSKLVTIYILTNQAYKEMRFREVVKLVFHDMYNIWPSIKDDNPFINRLFKYIFVRLISPIMPSFEKYLSSEVTIAKFIYRYKLDIDHFQYIVSIIDKLTSVVKKGKGSHFNFSLQISPNDQLSLTDISTIEDSIVNLNLKLDISINEKLKQSKVIIR